VTDVEVEALVVITGDLTRFEAMLETKKGSDPSGV
jgi:hypothetical protein